MAAAKSGIKSGLLTPSASLCIFLSLMLSVSFIVPPFFREIVLHLHELLPFFLVQKK